jgi:hypothetical protein
MLLKDGKELFVTGVSYRYMTAQMGNYNDINLGFVNWRKSPLIGFSTCY